MKKILLLCLFSFSIAHAMEIELDSKGISELANKPNITKYQIKINPSLKVLNEKEHGSLRMSLMYLHNFSSNAVDPIVPVQLIGNFDDKSKIIVDYYLPYSVLKVNDEKKITLKTDGKAIKFAQTEASVSLRGSYEADLMIKVGQSNFIKRLELEVNSSRALYKLLSRKYLEIKSKKKQLKKQRRYILWGGSFFSLSLVGFTLYAFRNQLTYFGPAANLFGSLWRKS